MLMTNLRVYLLYICDKTHDLFTSCYYKIVEYLKVCREKRAVEFS